MIRYAGNPLAVIMIKLFNLCLIHGYVLNSVCHSVIVSVVKDKMEIMTPLITIDLVLYAFKGF